MHLASSQQGAAAPPTVTKLVDIALCATETQPSSDPAAQQEVVGWLLLAAAEESTAAQQAVLQQPLKGSGSRQGAALVATAFMDAWLEFAAVEAQRKGAQQNLALRFNARHRPCWSLIRWR
jgi:hypothetical protein